MKKIIQNRHTPFWLLVFATLIMLTIPKLIQDGMFMDAVLFTSVSHNLSQGIGSFWFPQFSVHNLAITGVPAFLEQPPLVYSLQSLFFSVLGDSMYVERFYTFLTMCITALLIVLLWKEIFRNNKEASNVGWVPLILWITIPICFWSYSNNMIENTMGIFTLSSVLFAYKAFRNEKAKLLYWIISGLCVFLATLSKGLPGFFPLAVPVLYWLTTKKIIFRKALLFSMVMATVPLLIYVVLFMLPESSESLSVYLFKRVFARINSDPNVGSRFYILLRLFYELLPSIITVVFILIVAGFRKSKEGFFQKFNEGLFFFSIGLAGSLPLMLTRVQKGFYFVPALPFFAIGFSIYISPFILRWINRIEVRTKAHKISIVLGVVLFASTITFSLMQLGKTSRNRELLHDVYAIGAVVPKYSVVSVPDFKTWNQWDLQSYLMRYFNISLEDKTKNEFMLVKKGWQPDTLLVYEKMNIETYRYDMYKEKY